MTTKEAKVHRLEEELQQLKLNIHVSHNTIQQLKLNASHNTIQQLKLNASHNTIQQLKLNASHKKYSSSNSRQVTKSTATQM